MFLVGRTCKIIDNKVRLSLGSGILMDFNQRFMYLDLPPNLVNRDIKQVHIIPRFDAKYLEIAYIYETERIPISNRNDDILAIDLGLNNFAACIDTKGTTFIIEGRGIKSYNRWYNMNKARLQSIYKKQGIEDGNKMRHLCIKRKNVIDNYMNQAVSYIIKHCLKNGIGTIIFGNGPIKIKSDLVDFNNKIITQNFNYIPYRKFTKKLHSKADLYGIEVIEIDEDYTSITCSDCKFSDIKNRIKRGYFHCRECDLQIHADINAAINIGRKVAPGFRSSGCMTQPARIRVVDF